MRMSDYSVAFPKKVNIDQYMPIIDAALKTAKGADGLPRVMIEDYETYQLATRAANAIRSYSSKNQLNLRVSVPENSKSITVYKGKPRAPFTRKKKDAGPTTSSEPVT